ncbi:unnamed protein product [Protopolystoma xenopodis]|uniref:Ciliary BBSome complex subunit 2 N-terminal domain-containing protein n=1 Tax=Protopolystoma xenopodis TaxID=117903 RepID=A0A448XRW7_9PLAT|nr:unnamed protein product [Protopolystoma xenopodis]
MHEFSDGINCLLLDSFTDFDQSPIIIIGGNCAILGLDILGNEVFWTVTGDSVSAITTLCSKNNTNKDLVVGSNDFDLRIFRKDAIVSDITETGSKNQPVCLYSYEYSLNNDPILVTGWSNGKVYNMVFYKSTIPDYPYIFMK